MKLIKVASVLLFAVTGVFASAQVLFHDDWEQYRAGTQDWQANYGFGPFDINYEAGEVPPTVVEGSRDGMAPYSGTKMYDFRASAIKFGRILGHGMDLKSSVYPIVDYSIRFAVPQSYKLNTTLHFGLLGTDFYNGNSASAFPEFDLFKNNFRGFASTAQPYVLPRNVWNELRVRINWQNRSTSIFLNWQLLASKTFVTGQKVPPYSVDMLDFGVFGNETYSNQYDVATGVPGMLVDDISIAAVPEPKTWVISSLGLLAICCRGMRRKAF